MSDVSTRSSGPLQRRVLILLQSALLLVLTVAILVLAPVAVKATSVLTVYTALYALLKKVE